MTQTETEHENNSDREVTTDKVVYPSMTQTETDHNVCVKPVSYACVKLKPGQTVTFMKQNSGGLQKAKVLGRAGKVSGKYKN